MNVWQAMLFGLVQGLTEFLPVSSSGHLYLLSRILGVATEGGEYMVLSVFLHVCTLIPVAIVLWKEIMGLFKKPYNRLLCLIIATIPAGIVGIIYEVVGGDALFGGGYLYVLAAFFAITAGLLLFAEYLNKKSKNQGELTYKSALYMGVAQAFGTLPGISRSGITITGGTLSGLKNEENANFAFIMSIPIILASALVEGYHVIKHGVGNLSLIPMLVGGLVAVVSGYVAIKFMLRIVKKANYKYFSLYLILLSASVIILKATGVL